jgi:hypothetical protein
VYLAQIYGYDLAPDAQAQQAADADTRARLLRSEELVAACMREQGFDYTPQDLYAQVTGDGTGPDAAWGTREFAEQYGYGVSTDPWGTAEDAPDAPDPDADARAAMSDAERAAYDEALHGPGQDDPDAAYDWSTGGCTGAAQHEIDTTERQDPGEHAALEEEITRALEAVWSDPRIARVDAAWATCMADAGYPEQTTPGAAQSTLMPAWSTVQGWDDPAYQAALEGWDYDADPAGPSLAPPDPAAVAEFTAHEIAMALADLDCQDAVDHDATTREVDHALQQEFVDAHRAELDAWVAEAAQGR